MTDEIQRAIAEGLKATQVGILHLFIKHTSAALSINENYDSGEQRSGERAAAASKAAELGCDR